MEVIYKSTTNAFPDVLTHMLANVVPLLGQGARIGPDGEIIIDDGSGETIGERDGSKTTTDDDDECDPAV